MNKQAKTKPPAQKVLIRTEPLSIPPVIPESVPGSSRLLQPIPPLLPPLQRKWVPPEFQTGHIRDEARSTGGQGRGVKGEDNLVGRENLTIAASWHLAGLTWVGEAVLPPQL